MSIYAILAWFVLHNYTNRVHDYAFQDGMRADANFVRLRLLGPPLLNIRGTAPKRPPKFSCTSSCPQVPNSLCSSLTLALLGSALLPHLCFLGSLGNLPTRPVTKYAGSQLHPGSWKTSGNLPPLRLMQIQVQVLAWPPTRVCGPGCVI